MLKRGWSYDENKEHKKLCFTLIGTLFIGGNVGIVNVSASDTYENEVKSRVLQEVQDELAFWDENDSIRSIDKKDIPKDVSIIQTSTVEEYRNVFYEIFSASNREKEIDIPNTELEQISKRKVKLYSRKKLVKSETKMYTASNVIANFNLSALIKEYSDNTVNASKCKLTLSGLTAFHKLTDIEYVTKYSSGNKVVKVQANFGITYYVASPWGSYDVLTDNKNQYFHYSVSKGIYDYDVVG